MRNLKRALSLALASVMVLGLMIVGSSAKTADFKDADSINEDYEEAIDVLTTIGILDENGTGDGSFEPQGHFTRAMAAKIIATMMLGAENAEKLPANNDIFKDVAAEAAWASGYITYCANNGFIAGDGSGNFNPTVDLTGVQLGKLLLVALGYDAKVEGYVDDPSWSVNVASAMVSVGIDVDGITFSDPITREQAAQMILNTIKTPLVEYTNRTQVTVDGTSIVVGGDTPQYTVTTAADEQTISRNPISNTDKSKFLVEFGERFIPKLKLSQDEDVFMRPCYTWTYDKTEIMTYLDEDKLVYQYTTPVDGRDLFNLLGKTTIEDSSFAYYIDGKVDDTITQKNMVRANTNDYATTGYGILTQVFLNKSSNDLTITSINTYLAEAHADYDKNAETLDVNMWAPFVKKDNSVTLDEIAGIEKYEKGDKFLVNVATEDDGATYEIVDIYDVETIPAVSLNRYAYDKYVYNGNEQIYYDKNATASYNPNRLSDIDVFNQDTLRDKTYDLYIDLYGYMIGNILVEGKDPYLFLTGYDLLGSNLANKTATANVIFLDGTSKNIQVNVDDTNAKIGTTQFYTQLSDNTEHGDSEYNKWFTYKTKGDVYTLTPVPNWMNVQVTGSEKTVNSYDFRAAITGDGTSTGVGYTEVASGTKASVAAWGDDESVFITVEAKKVNNTTSKGISKVNGVYTGLDDVDITIQKNDGYVVSTKTPGANNLVGKSLVAGSDNTPSTWVRGKDSNPSMFIVYDEEDFVIGAILIGEDTSSTKNFGYIIKNMSEEWIEGDYTYWDFQAVVDGKVTKLTAKEYQSEAKFADYANTLKWDHTSTATSGLVVFEYDSDGYVVGAQHVSNDTRASVKLYDNSDYSLTTNPDNYNVYDIEWQKSGESSVTANNPAGITAATLNAELAAGADFEIDVRSLKGADNDAGIRTAQGAPVIVVYQEKYQSGVTNSTYKVFDDLKSAVDFINEKIVPNNSSVKFNGYVSAVLDDRGYAEWTVIKCLDTYGDIKDESGKTSSGKISGVSSLPDISQGTPANVDTNIKKLPSGVYQINDTNVKDVGGANKNDVRGKADENLIFVFKTTTASESATLTILSETGQIMYVEDSGALSSAGGHYFYVQVLDSNNGGTLANSGIGPMETTPLKAGTYSYTIETSGGVTFDGEFTVN